VRARTTSREALAQTANLRSTSRASRIGIGTVTPCNAARTEELQFDHVLPVALGGATSVENLQILCGDCNRATSDAL